MSLMLPSGGVTHAALTREGGPGWLTCNHLYLSNLPCASAAAHPPTHPMSLLLPTTHPPYVPAAAHPPTRLCAPATVWPGTIVWKSPDGRLMWQGQGGPVMWQAPDGAIHS